MNEVAIHAAQVAIAAQLLHWGAPHARDRARELVDDLLRRGWIPPDESTPVPKRHKRNEFVPENPAPPEKAAEHIARLRRIVSTNPPPPPSEKP